MRLLGLRLRRRFQHATKPASESLRGAPSDAAS